LNSLSGFRKFILNVLIFGLALLLVFYILFTSRVLIVSFTDVLIGFAINFANVFIGGWILMKAMKKDNTGFLLYSFGSMIIRLFFVLILVLVVILSLNVDKKSFLLSLIGFHFLFLAIEIVFLLNYNKSLKQTNI